MFPAEIPPEVIQWNPRYGSAASQNGRRIWSRSSLPGSRTRKIAENAEGSGHAVELPQIHADGAGKPFAHGRFHSSDHTRSATKGYSCHIGVGGPVQNSYHIALVSRSYDEIRSTFEIVVKRPDIVRERLSVRVRSPIMRVCGRNADKNRRRLNLRFRQRYPIKRGPPHRCSGTDSGDFRHPCNRGCGFSGRRNLILVPPAPELVATPRHPVAPKPRSGSDTPENCVLWASWRRERPH